MTLWLSIYLDLIRALAAILVLLSHASLDRLGGGWLQPAFAQAGTPSVIVFFVLSGFVIAWTAETKERAFKPYIINRLARLWSVVIPALIVTAIADPIGRTIDPAIYPSFFPPDHPVERLIAAAGFLNQLWFFDIRPLSNAPYWSLSYEWWYYVAFGCFALVRGRAAWLLGLAAIVVMGPRILLLFPVWLLGVAVYRRIELGKRLPVLIAVIMFLAPLGIVGIFALDQAVHFNQQMAAALGPHLYFPNIFAFAMMSAVLVAMNLLSFPALEQFLAGALRKIEKPVRAVAGATLSIYLYHFPLLLLFGALLHVRATSPAWVNGVILIGTLGCCFALSAVTERRKHLVRAWIEAGLQGLFALTQLSWRRRSVEAHLRA
jgi:peptidoglycan/LPS O-acetylase OafA/YrhL